MTMDCLRDGEENSLSNGLAANNRLCNDSTSTSATSSTVDSNENENDTLGVKVEKSSPDFREAVRNENIREGKEIKDEDDVPLLQRKQKMGSHKKKVDENHKIQNCERKEKIVIINDISVKPEPSSPKKHTPDEKPVIKRELKRPVSESDSEDDVPLSFRAKKAKRPSDVEQKKGKKRKSDDDDERYSPVPKKEKKKHKHHKHHHHSDKKKSKHKDEKGKKDITGSPSKKQKQDDQLKSDVWKWWEDDSREEGIKWKTLEHSGPLFAAPYEPLPKAVKMKYEGKSVALSEAAEEVATFYARMLDHDYTSKPVFRKNFFKDWRKVMTSEERASITDLGKCDFRDIHKYFQEKSEERKQMSKEEKQKIKVVKEKEQMKHGFAYMDGYKQKIGNFRIEPPGLFRGRGEHPRMGKLKKRVMPEDVIINCSKGSKVPSPPAGHKWKEVRHDNTVTWLCSWVENVLGQNKYVMLNPSSKIKGQKDWEKYEVARKLKGKVDEIRDTYTNDFKSKEMRSRQRAVALYFIDRLALRAGNEKDDTEAADTVGCCSLRCEHITLHDTYTFDDERGEKPHVVEFDFLGKDSIRYTNLVPVEKRVYKNLQIFMENKKPQDDLFDRLDTASLNKHLQEQMPGLTAKVFRTYNASITLQRQLDKLTREEDSMPEKLLSYNRANREVAILCNHQRSVPKSHENSMKNLKEKIKNKKKEIKEAKELLDSSRRSKDEEKVKKKLARFKEQLKKLKLQETDKDEGKTIALGTSKLNYLDPRITVAWCKKHDVPIEKAYNKTQREKFHWAIEMAGPNFVF